LKLVIEICWFLWSGKELRKIAIEENSPAVEGEKWESFQFLQEFYLYFAQFYAHMSYALAVSILCLGLSLAALDPTSGGLSLLVVLYLTAGFFFTIGRIQLAGLFKAEGKLTEGNRKPATGVADSGSAGDTNGSGSQV